LNSDKARITPAIIETKWYKMVDGIEKPMISYKANPLIKSVQIEIDRQYEELDKIDMLND
jgi:hypothetical protein